MAKEDLITPSAIGSRFRKAKAALVRAGEWDALIHGKKTHEEWSLGDIEDDEQAVDEDEL